MHNLNKLHKVAVHDSKQHTGNCHLVVLRKLTHNCTVQCNKAWIAWVDGFYKDIAGVHVGMEKVIAEYLRKENG
ncbi:Uncharacterised protein [Acinetobacter baumannii]|nr:Uncharacterised protein [Acinetobacter baumannii]